MNNNIQNTEIKELLQSYVKNTFQFSKSDPLTNVYANGVLNLATQPRTFDSTWEKLYKSVKNSQKEFGINPLCISRGVLSLKWKEIDYQIPIFLQQVNIQIDKLSREVLLENVDEPNLNPFLFWFFEREFNKALPHSFDEIKVELSEYSIIKIEESNEFIGNFHPHRFESLREIEQLIDSDSYSFSLSQLLGILEGVNPIKLTLSRNELLPADPDQIEVFKELNYKNCVVQGPPGTGKSQVIVNLLGKLLEIEKSTLVISEKRVALDVIHKKMTALGLGGLCYTSTQHFSNTDFVQDLKKEWERLEIAISRQFDYTLRSNLIQNKIQNTLDLLHQPKLANGKTILDFLVQYEPIRKNKNSGYSSELPTLEDWDKHKVSYEFIFKNDLQFLLSQIKTELLEKSFLLSIESKIQSWHKLLVGLCLKDKSINYKQLYELARKSITYAKFNTSIFKKYGTNFMKKPTLLNKLIRLKKQFATLSIELKKSEIENSHWLILPNKAEVNELIKRFKNSSFFTGFLLKKEWKKWTRSPFLDPISSLELRLFQIDIQEKWRSLEIELHKFGINNTTDLEEILQLLKVISEEELNEFQAVSEFEKRFFEEKQLVFTSLLGDFKLYFHFDDSTDLVDYFKRLEKSLFILLEHCDPIVTRSKSLSLLSRKYNSIQEIEEAIMHSTWSKLKMDFPQLIDFSWSSFYQKIDELLLVTEEERVDFANFLLYKQKNKFGDFHELLAVSAHKLTGLQKDIKQELKAGKRILVKEFAKTRNHLSIRQLMDSPAKIWIQLLKPIWLMNPSRISACFPLKKNMFSMAIFDEASQIPIENSFGALQRAERILIAGDPQQMSPSSYFSTTSESVDLLHQASFYLPSKFLSYHYRSYHPELISFSNLHFYQNRLSAFKHANYLDNPIKFNYLPQGRYDNRVNSIEAKEVADYISKRLSSSETLGIVAFSESQLQEIANFLNAKTKGVLQQRIDSDEIFFTSVENVQGDECDELIVSFGYGYSDQEGVFAHRFGPINLISGAKRLNVLFTRARKKITFFTSVCHDDFKQSSNESVEILRKWFRKMDEIKIESHSESCKIHVKDIIRNHRNGLEIKTLFSIYKDRNWMIDCE